MADSSFTVALIGQQKAEIVDHFFRQATRLGCAYADLRLEVVESQFGWAENGQPKQSGREDALAIGIRVIAGDGMRAPGYFGQTLGTADRDRLARVIRNGLGQAHTRALGNARGKSKMETGYAGRSWLLRSLDNTQVGQQIASPLVTAFSDPALPGFGHSSWVGTPG